MGLVIRAVKINTGQKGTLFFRGHGLVEIENLEGVKGVGKIPSMYVWRGAVDLEKQKSPQDGNTCFCPADVYLPNTAG